MRAFLLGHRPLLQARQGLLDAKKSGELERLADEMEALEAEKAQIEQAEDVVAVAVEKDLSSIRVRAC